MTCKLDILSFIKTVDTDIKEFLSQHYLKKTRRPYVSVALNPNLFCIKHPQLYQEIVQRLEYDDDLDEISNYLCKTYPEYLVNAKEIYGSVQRLEDVISFSIYKYEEYCQSYK